MEKYSSEKSKRHQSTINVNTVADDGGRTHGEREVFPQLWLSKECQFSRGSWGGGGEGGLPHPLQLTTGLVVNSLVITSPTLAGERMLLIPKVSILSEQINNFTHGANGNFSDWQ